MVEFDGYIASKQASEIARNFHMGMEQRDLDRIMSCYGEDSEIKIVDRNHPPSSPLILHGRREIQDHYQDVFGRDLTHKILAEVAGEHYVAFTDECQYANGTKVLATDMCEVTNGKIARQTTLQEWDE